MKIEPSIFRAYDIRGIVDTQLTSDAIYHIGRAFGSLAIEKGQKTIVFGRDGRVSSPQLAASLQQGLLSTGCNIIDIGIVPSPLVYFATYHLQIPNGIVLTGSHNPADCNGVKMVLAGNTLSAAEIQGLYSRILSQHYINGNGQYSTTDIKPHYLNYILGNIKLNKKLKIVIDCANATAGVIAPELYTALGCEVIALYPEVDGRFPNHHPDPSEPANLQDLIYAVKKHQADIGLAFDGDADRLGVITNKGEIIWPDRQLILYAKEILKNVPKAKFVYDVKCTRHVRTQLEAEGGTAIMSCTGHSLIKTKLKEEQAQLAGEMSGHIFFNDKWFGFDDGIYAGARLLEILSNSDKTSSELFAEIPNSLNTPELKLAITEDKKQSFMQQLINSIDLPDASLMTIDGLRVEFNDGWGLIRPSNTTAHLILRFEADTQERLNEIIILFREKILNVDSTLKLPKEMLF